MGMGKIIMMTLFVLILLTVGIVAGSTLFKNGYFADTPARLTFEAVDADLCVSDNAGIFLDSSIKTECEAQATPLRGGVMCVCDLNF